MATRPGTCDVLTSAGWQHRGSAVVPPPPPPTQPMLLGADEPGTNSYTAWSNRMATVGQMGIRRCYDGPNWNLNYSAGAAAATVGHNMVNWLSFTPNLASMASGALDGNLTTFAASIPSTEKAMITIKHEPEDADPTTWRNAHRRAYSVIKANVATPANVKVGPCFQGYTYNPASGRKWATDWNVGVGYADFNGMDYYQPYHYPLTGNSPNWTDMSTTIWSNFQSICDQLGVPGAIGEIGSAEDTTLTYKGVYANPQHKIDWMQSCLDWAHEHGFVAVCYFDSYKPGDTDPSIVLDSTTQFKNYWQTQCAAHPARTFS